MSIYWNLHEFCGKPEFLERGCVLLWLLKIDIHALYPQSWITLTKNLFDGMKTD